MVGSLQVPKALISNYNIVSPSLNIEDPNPWCKKNYPTIIKNMLRDKNLQEDRKCFRLGEAR